MGALLHALHAHQPLPLGPYPTLRWPAGLDHLPKPAKPHREFFSRALNTTVRVAYELDTEPAHYQGGTVAVDLTVDEIWIGGWNAIEHLSSASCECVHAELMRELGL